MCTQLCIVVACVCRILHIQAALTTDGVSLDSAEELSALTSEHRAQDKLNHALEGRLVELGLLKFLV